MRRLRDQSPPGYLATHRAKARPQPRFCSQSPRPCRPLSTPIQRPAGRAEKWRVLPPHTPQPHSHRPPRECGCSRQRFLAKPPRPPSVHLGAEPHRRTPQCHLLRSSSPSFPCRSPAFKGFSASSQSTLNKIETVLAPKNLAIHHIAGRTKHTRINSALGISLVTDLHRLAVRLLQQTGR